MHLYKTEEQADIHRNYTDFGQGESKDPYDIAMICGYSSESGGGTSHGGDGLSSSLLCTPLFAMTPVIWIVTRPNRVLHAQHSHQGTFRGVRHQHLGGLMTQRNDDNPVMHHMYHILNYSLVCIAQKRYANVYCHTNQIVTNYICIDKS